MIVALADPQIWASFATLTALEIVLGVDNLVFIALLAGRLAPDRRGQRPDPGSRPGAGFTPRAAVVDRLAGSPDRSGRLDCRLCAVVARPDPDRWRRLSCCSRGHGKSICAWRARTKREAANRKPPSFASTILQIVLFDIVFSLDSVITAVGLAEHVWVMVAAIVVAMVLMLLASNSLAAFIDRHASVKMLALSFLLLIGTMLVADGLGFHIPRGYVYAAMGFSVMVESLNIIVSKRRRARRLALREAGGGAA